jgi:uncharacterized DUF497 family protein
MLVGWDPGKARLNSRKHRVSFADAVAALEDERALTMHDPFCDEEERWITIGLDTLGRVIVLIYTWRGEIVSDLSSEGDTARTQALRGSR